MMSIIYILFAVLGLYLAWGVIYQFSYAIAALFWKDQQWASSPVHKKTAVFIPGYKEDSVIVNTAKNAIKQAYPTAQYEVIVIADSFSEKTLNELKALDIRLEEVSFEKSTKSKALNTVLKRMQGESFDIAIILDADNLMQADFLTRVNDAFASGTRVLQGRRAAKNADTSMAILDGLSEDINNHILCKGHSILGLSARLAGSAMAFDWALFNQVMPQIDAIGGFDKELELRLTAQGERVIYDPLAVVFDEKVRKGQHFSQQRSRWIAAQFHYAARFFPAAIGRLLSKGQVDHFNKASQMLLPPRLLTPGILAGGSLLLALLGIYDLALLWAIIFILNITTFLVAMPAYAWQSPYKDALMRLPFAFGHALIALLGLGKANKKFIHTPHGEEL